MFITYFKKGNTMQNLTKFGCVLILGVYGAVGSVMPYQSYRLENTNSINRNLIQPLSLGETQAPKSVSEMFKQSTPSEWYHTVSYLENPVVENGGRSAIVKCKISEEDQYQNFRERVIEKSVPILIKKDFIPNADKETSQLILTSYIEVNDIEELKSQDRYLELQEPKEISLPNQKELAGWQNDDTILKANQLSKLYAMYEGEKFYVDQEAKFREGNIVQEYVLERSELIRSRNFEDGVYDCVESIPHNNYKRPDGSEYTQLLSAEIQKTHKPIQTKQIGWQIDDLNLIATQTMQDFVISGGNELNVGTVKNGAIQGYVKENEVAQCVGKLTFVNGKLEQKKVSTINYRRPDGSLYIMNNVPLASEIQGIPHTLTFSNGAWVPTANAFRQGTFQAFNGCFGVVDGNTLTKYQKDGTVIRRAALPHELAAFAPTKSVLCYKWRRHGWNGCRWTDTGEYITVLATYPGGSVNDDAPPNNYKKQPVNWNAIFAAE